MRAYLRTPLATLLASIGLTLAVAVQALAPTPASSQGEPIAIDNVTVHVGNGEVIAEATVGFADGRITAVGTDVDTTGHRVIDGAGQHLYPGFVLPDSRLGLEEVSSIEDTIDSEETGQVNPNVRSLVAYNTDSEMGPTLRFNGVLVAQVAPTGGLVSGSSSIVQLDAWNWEDAVLMADDGIFVNWPPKRQGRFDFSTFTFKFEKNKQYDGQMLAMQTLFDDAGTYAKRGADTASNLKLAAMQGLYTGATRLFVRTDVARDAVRAVEFARRHGVEHVVIVGDYGLLPAADYLAEHEVGVIVMGVHRLPGEAHDDIHAPYAFAGKLVAAGVKTGLTNTGLFNSRNLPFQAGTAGAYGGLDREQALRLITLSNAELLGIDDRVGSIAVGKEATLFVSRGDALDMRTNVLTHAFIGGRELTLEGTQQELYERFRQKYSSISAP
ncbi:MAG: amidohydrolase family protein [Pseudomonadota bacterium]